MLPDADRVTRLIEEAAAAEIMPAFSGVWLPPMCARRGRAIS